MRLHDHAALAMALALPHPLQLVFVFDTEILARFSNPRDRRLSFLARRLAWMDAQLAQRGGGMLILAGNAREIMPTLAKAVHASEIICAEDYEPATIARDDYVAQQTPCTFTRVVDHVIHPPYHVVKDDGTPFKVFTPYYKKWLSRMTPLSAAEYKVEDAGRYAAAQPLRDAARRAGLKVLSTEPEAMLEAIGYQLVEDSLWRVDDVPARLGAFIEHKLHAYKTARDFLAGEGTSMLSTYLRFGLVSVRECVRAANSKGGGEKWVNELCWREFNIAILYHYPHVVHTEFVAQYQHRVPWRDAPADFDAFCAGRTGYPVVDAAVRQLLTDGWMHNRARMIVASFLTKDLFIDWRLGEAFFAQYLMDYELASNAGGWQWAASTGTDAAPYFRIFNPLLQSQKFDADGSYIRTYVPELRGLDKKDIHAPAESLLRPPEYPLPIVDHKTAKDHAVAVFKALGHKMGDVTLNS